MLRKWKQMLHSGYFVRLLWMVLLSIIAALVVFAAVIYTSYGTLYLSSLSSRGQTTAAEICGGLESALMDYSTAVDELAAGRLTRRWLTQWTGGEHPTVTQAAGSHNSKLDVAGEVNMLQTVVADNHIDFRMLGQQHFCRTDTVTAHCDGAVR